QSTMSLQLLMALVQEPFSKLGQAVTEPQPIDASGSSSPVPQIWSAPPQRALMPCWSFACARDRSGAVIGSVWQSVFAGRRPAALASSHLPGALSADWRNLEESFAMARWHRRGSLRAGFGARSARAGTSRRVRRRIFLTSRVDGTKT